MGTDRGGSGGERGRTVVLSSDNMWSHVVDNVGGFSL